MPGAEAWCALADEVVSLGDAGLMERVRQALAGLPIADTERADLLNAIAGRQDPAGLLLLAVASGAPSATPALGDSGDPAGAHPAASPAEMDAALALSQQLLSGPAPTLGERVAAAASGVLAALPADAAGSFVAGLVTASLSLPDAPSRSSALRAVLDTTRDVTLSRLPVAAVVGATASATSDDARLVGVLLGRVPTARLLSGVLDALRGGTDPASVLAVLQRVVDAQAMGRPTPAPPRPAPVPPPAAAGYGAPPPSPPGAGPGSGSGISSWVKRWTSRAAGPVWRGGHSAPRDLPPPPASPPAPGVPAPMQPAPTQPAPTQPATRTAYPRIDVDAHRAVRPEVAVLDEPFDVTVGLAKYPDAAITQTGPMPFLAGAVTDVDLVLVYDPTSLVPQGSTRLTLHVTDADPYPSATVTFVAQYRPDLPTERRIGVHYLRDGQVVGIAWKSVVVVPYEKDVAAAPVSTPSADALLDLEPLLGADLPDLLLSICASDGPPGEFVWTAYAGASDVTVPDAPGVSSLDGDPGLGGLQGFVTEMRQTVAFSQGPYADYLTLVGKAKRMGRAVPDGIQQVLRAVVTDPARTSAATVLLLTEELTLPWELTVLDPPIDTRWGGVSPFLGAHAAIARWPLTEHKPRPTPRASVTVRHAAVLTADYTGVTGWGKLEHAVEEAAEIAALFAPPAVTVRPALRDVVGMLRGTPPADVLHVALHGQFDAKGAQEGLVLLGTDAAGQPTAKWQFFTPDQVETGQLEGGPFVFLNACQVASDKRVLGDYGGFASTLLRIGASGVVAPLWNVDDDVAAQLARDFYAATWTAAGGAPVSAAEAVRALRATYTEAATLAETPGITATLIAFQVFGHPRLRLDHGS